MGKIAGKHGMEEGNGQAASCAVELCFAPEAFPGFTTGTHLAGSQPDFTDIGADNRPWPLKVYTLSRFSLVRDGRKVEFSGKVQQKPLTMLKVLIALGGRKDRRAHV